MEAANEPKKAIVEQHPSSVMVVEGGGHDSKKSELDSQKSEESIGDASKQKPGEEITPELEMREEVTASPTPQEDKDLQIIEEQSPGGNVKTEEASEEDQAIQSPEEMKRIILVQSQLKTLSETSYGTFRSAVIGCFVRVTMHSLPQSYADRVFIDQIVDILEPQSYQHLWLNRRFRLAHLGDFELSKVVTMKVQQESELRPWFDYMEAKGEPLPTQGFIKRKERDVNFAMQEVALMERNSETDGVKKPEKVQIRREDLAKIALNPVALRSLAKLSFERFRQVVLGCFVCMPAIRRDKSKDCQYHIVPVLDCVRGPRKYKVRNVALIDFQLVLPFYGNYILNWVKSFAIVTDEGFRTWLEDMKQWKEPIPTPSKIREKAAELQLALNEAERIPTMVDIEKRQREEEERAKRAKLPVQSAKDLEPCQLSRAQLEKLAKLEVEAEVLGRVLTGTFVRLNSGDSFELDQILALEEKQGKGGRKERVLELKFAGTISLTALSYIASPGKAATEEEFGELARKMEAEGEALPNNEFVGKKRVEIGEVLGEEAEEGKAAGNGAAAQVHDLKESQGGDGTGTPSIEPKKEASEWAGRERRPMLSVPTKDGQLTVANLRKVLLSMKKVVDMMACDKDVLSRIIRGFYARIAARRPDKSSKQQYYIDQVVGVSWGGEPYRIRGNVLTDIQLQCRKMGSVTVNRLYRMQGDNFTDEALVLFAEDMKKWKLELPTLAWIEKKYREFVVANARAPKFPRGSSLGRAGEVSFIGGRRPEPQSTPGKAQFDQLQRQIQRQVVTSVRATPGLGPNWAGNVPPSQPMQLSPFTATARPSPRAFADPAGSWQRQTDAFISGIGTKRGMETEQQAMERESWRMQQQGQFKQEYAQEEAYQQRPPFNTDDPFYAAQMRDHPMAMNPRDYPTAAQQQQQQHVLPAYPDQGGGYDFRRSYEADQLFGSGGAAAGAAPAITASTSSMYYNTYVPAQKRSRLSPKPPPVERLF